MIKDNDKPKPKFEIVDKRFDRDEIDNEIANEPVPIIAEPSVSTIIESELKLVDSPEIADESKSAPDITGDEEQDINPDEEDIEEAMLNQLDIDIILQNTLGVAIQLAFVYLGMQPDPKTKLIQQNIGKASRAINFVDFCIQIYSPSFDDKTKAELFRVLQMLKMQFVQITQPLNPNGGPTATS